MRYRNAIAGYWRKTYWGIVAISVGFGLGAAVLPAFFQELPENIRLLVQNGIVVGCVSAILLNVIFNFDELKKLRKANTERELNDIGQEKTDAI